MCKFFNDSICNSRTAELETYTWLERIKIIKVAQTWINPLTNTWLSGTSNVIPFFWKKIASASSCKVEIVKFLLIQIRNAILRYNPKVDDILIKETLNTNNSNLQRKILRTSLW